MEYLWEGELLALAVAVEALSDHPLAQAIVKDGRERLNGRALPAAGDLKSLTGRGVTARRGQVAVSGDWSRHRRVTGTGDNAAATTRPTRRGPRTYAQSFASSPPLSSVGRATPCLSGAAARQSARTSRTCGRWADAKTQASSSLPRRSTHATLESAPDA